MSFRDLAELCYRNLLRRRTRTLLAVIGVIVGTCAIVVMMSIGFGLTRSYEDQIESYGDLHMIEIYGNSGGSSMSGEEQKGVLNDNTLKEISEMKGVEAVTPVLSAYMTVGIDDYITSLEIKGIDPEIFAKFNYEIAEGRGLAKNDEYAILFGSEIPNWFYDPNENYSSAEDLDVITDELVLTADWNYGYEDDNESDSDIEYELYEIEGIGVLAPRNDSPDYCAYMNIATLEEIQKDTDRAEGNRGSSSAAGQKTYQQALVYIDDIEDAEKISKDLKDEGYQAYSPIDWISRMKDTMAMIQGVLGGIGGISLLVAALGITNTMVMSIYERTREIGVMKVIGANLRDIKRMFLIEAGMIGFLGGFIGIVISLIISLMMNTVLKDLLSIVLSDLGGYGSTISYIPPWLILAALTFSTLIGVIAGYSPAKRAMNLSALESLRNE